MSVEQLTDALGDRYRIQRELGQGGMAVVYLADDLKHERSVAIKVLRPEIARALGAQRFLNEIRTTARLAHPHILPLHDSGEAGELLYYFMPFVAGESLRQRLDREEPGPTSSSPCVRSRAFPCTWRRDGCSRACCWPRRGEPRRAWR